MIVLTTATNQTFSIIPISQSNLSGNDIILEFTNETTKEVINVLSKYTKSVSDFLNVRNYIITDLISNFKIRVSENSGIFEAEICLLSTLNNIDNINPDTNFSFLKENTFYSLKVYLDATNEIIYKDRIFCTNQTVKEYSINQNEYFTPNIDNNFYKI